jgi:hypothetical protein
MKVRAGLYKHYKGNLYRVLGVGRHSETLEEMVVYQELYGDHGLWVRPAKMFVETVSVNSLAVPRFEWISESLDQNVDTILDTVVRK